MMSIKQFVKDWTLPVAIAVGTIVYLTFYFVPQLDAAGETLGAVVDTIFPMMVFCTLFSTFCRIDFHQMKPHRWHVGVLLAQVVLRLVSNKRYFGRACLPVSSALRQRQLLWLRRRLGVTSIR